jgi:hypothetical protein
MSTCPLSQHFLDMVEEEVKRQENQERIKSCLNAVVNYIGQRLYPYVITAALTIVFLILMTGLTVYKVFRN